MKSFLLLLTAASFLASCTKPSRSTTKEFQFSADICAEVTKATDERWSSSLGITKREYFDNLIATEKVVVAKELDKYRTRSEDIANHRGPADGPGGKFIYLSDGVSRSSEIQSHSQMDATVSLAQEVCAGCSKEEIQSKLSLLEKNNTDLGTCTYTGAEGHNADAQYASEPSTEDSAKQAQDVEQLKNLVVGASNAKALCEWWGDVSGGVGAERDRCVRSTISSFCTAALNGAANATASTVGGSSTEGVVTSATKVIPGAVKDAIIGCVQQMAYDTVKEALKNAGTREFLPSTTQDLAKQAIQSDALSDDLKEQKAYELKKQIALLVCKAGTALISNQIDAQPQINFDNPCRAIFQGSKSRAKACINTTGSLCKIAAGDIQLANFLPEGTLDERPVETLATEAANAIAAAGCQAGGVSAVCGTISAAAEQIRSALTTGNNDWAHCLGTDQMGACGGTVYSEWLLGVKVGDAAQPVRPTSESKEDPSYVERDVCLCDYSCFQDDWGTNTELSRQSSFTVVSEGDAGDRECKNQDGRWNWTGDTTKDGYSIFWQKSGCRILKARSKTEEGFAQSGFLDVYEGATWVSKSAVSGSGSCVSPN